MKTKFYKAAIAAFFACSSLHAQNIFPSTGAAGIGTKTPDASSLLEIKSTTKGLLIPRMTQTQRNAIASPATGLMIYQTNATTGFYYYGGGGWKSVAAKAWNLTGNAGTNSSVNFIGTTDANPLVFRVNNVRAGFIDYDNAKGNTSFGYQNLISNTGGYNTAFGYNSLYLNTSGSNNTANGAYALFSNTTGIYNTANGEDALFSNTTGFDNTANGFAALYSNTTGDYNTVNGNFALYSNTTGDYNTVNGNFALYSNTTGDDNTANGYQALLSNTTGTQNTANGYQALYYNTTGGFNTANGYDALYYNTTGSDNTANGFWALLHNTTGIENTALGVGADASSTSVINNAIVIGYGAVVDASDKVRIGNTGASSIGGQVDWTSFSDGRYKKNIKEDVQGLKFIKLLKPITYTVDINGLNTHYDNLRKHDSAYDKAKAQMQSSADAASKIIYNGFIAQDVEKAAQSINYNFSGVDKPQNKDGLYGLRYAEFVVPLVKAVQELSKMNDAKDSAIQQQNIKINDLQNQINELKTLMVSGNQSAVSGRQLTVVSSASLEQNIPNPFTNTTTISYTLPQKITAAQIIITDKNGKTLKAVTISESGKGTVNVDASTLSSGAYQYSLIVDGRLIDTKQMVLAK